MQMFICLGSSVGDKWSSERKTGDRLILRRVMDSHAGCPAVPIDEPAAPMLFVERRNRNEKKYSAAARMIRDRIPVHKDIDSSIPPTSPPKRFEPSAWPLNLYSAKLRMNTMDANAIGEHRAIVATSAFTQNT